MKHRTASLVFFILIGLRSTAQLDSISIHVPFSTDSTHLTAWNGAEYAPVFLKGVNLGVSVPGTFPGQLAAEKDDYLRWFSAIQEAGFNHIRLYTLHFPRFYEALVEYNEQRPSNPLYFIQGVWLEEEIPNYSGDIYELSPFFSHEMRENVRSVHGDISIPFRFGKAHGDFTVDASPYCMAYLMGREIYPGEVNLGNTNHPSEISYSGEFLNMSTGSPVEVLLVAHLDSLIQFEWSEYQTMRPVSMSSWPTLDPITHPTETATEEDIEQIDLSDVNISNAPAGMFISYHAYPYYPDFISADPGYRTYSDQEGPNSYLGYLTDLKSHYQNMPLIIAEFGVPTSWGVAHYSASGMDHGGQTEQEAGEMGYRLLRTIETAGCGGGTYFAWINEWFKSTWITDQIEIGPSTRVLWPNIVAAEQNYGLFGYADTVAQWQTWSHSCVGCDITNVFTKAEVGEFQIFFETVTPFADGDTIYVAFDTYGDSLGERVLPNGDTLDVGAEFLLEITEGRAELKVMRSYDLYAIWHGTSDPDQLYRSTASTSGDWRIVRFKNNSSEQDIQYIGNLNIKQGFRNINSKDAVVVDTNSIFIRIPWTLLQFMDPSHKVVMHDDRSTPGRENDTTDGIRLQILQNGVKYSNLNRVTWQDWNVVTQVTEVPKGAYEIFKERMPLFPDFTLARVDAYTEIDDILTTTAQTGVLSNDVQFSGGGMEAILEEAPEKGFLQLNGDGSFQYIPSSLWDGSDQFSYRVFALGDWSVPAMVTLSGESEIDPSGELLKVYPVPVSDLLTIEALTRLNVIELLDSEGRLVHYEEPTTATVGIHTSALPSGAYILRITQGENILVRKVVVQR